MSQERFFAILKAEFSPRLRAAGLKGSGRHFCRKTGEVVHALSIQGNRSGGSCALNFGIHLTFLPDTLQRINAADALKEIDCEFRGRVAPGDKADYWWTYGDAETSPEASARSLIETYFRVGEPIFQRYSTLPAILQALEGRIVAVRDPSLILVHTTDARVALAAARIHRHCGNLADSRRCAQFGLAELARRPYGGALKAEFEALAR